MQTRRNITEWDGLDTCGKKLSLRLLLFSNSHPTPRQGSLFADLLVLISNSYQGRCQGFFLSCWKSYYSFFRVRVHGRVLYHARVPCYARGLDLGAFGFGHAPCRGLHGSCSDLDHALFAAIRDLYFVPDPLNVSFVAVPAPFNFVF